MGNKELFVLVPVLYWPDQVAVSIKFFAQHIMTIPAYKFKIQLNLLH